MVAGGGGELQHLLVVVDGLLVPALQPVDVAEADQRLHLGRLVAGGAGGGQRLLVEGFGVVVGAVGA